MHTPLQLFALPTSDAESRRTGLSPAGAFSDNEGSLQQQSSDAPSLALAWEPRRRNIAESFREIVWGISPAKDFAGDNYFRDCTISTQGPKGSFFIALAWHAAFIALLFPLWNVLVVSPVARLPQAEIIWYGPAKDFSFVSPAAASVKHALRPKLAAQPIVEEAAPTEDFHPRLTILNRPLRPNHPRQTLIQPAAPGAPPKILPALPNIVAFGAPDVPQPRMEAGVLTAPRARATSNQRDVAAPEVPDGQRQLNALNLATADASERKPALPVSQLTAPHAKSVRESAASLPDIAAVNSRDASNQTLIALSAAPAPVAPPSESLGNLSSRLSISPNAAKPGSPLKEGGGNGSAKTASNGSGPAGLSISGPTTKKLDLSATGVGGAKLPTQPGTVARRSSAPEASNREESTAMANRLRPGMAPETLLDSIRVYSLNINMPNLTSASGNWILNFAELLSPEDEAKSEASGYVKPKDLQGPEPLRKVDPKYPPELQSARIEGEVILYAVIRKDGTVDSIQLVRGIDPQLDANAMQALAQWKFRPATRQGVPVELEAIVHIPLHANGPADQ